MKEIIHTASAPAAVGPYSQATGFEKLLFVSGQLPIDPATGEITADEVKGQTRQCLENLKAVLEAGGSSLQAVLKASVYLKDISHFAAMNEVYASYFTEDPPARAAFEVAKLPKGALVEVEAIAIRS
ncbi:MAG: RidA family protein [Sphaerochaeta sp.]|jgi:2-iminobutanoate/2-iminopropanoate deaminase|nr:RidA family protein [Sphaerochaeta sp.]PKL28889.1 MAG: hypothetical protein CVV46_04405 [Spirochaetae bacterium HGW-Spirochaetae-2]